MQNSNKLCKGAGTSAAKLASRCLQTVLMFNTNSHTTTIIFVTLQEKLTDRKLSKNNCYIQIPYNN